MRTFLTIWKVGWIIGGALLVLWTIVVVRSFISLSHGFPALYLSEQESSLNPAYRQLVRDPMSNDGLAQVAFRNSSATWLFDEAMSDGTYRGGPYDFMVEVGRNTCRPSCQATLEFGFCTGSCAVLPPAAISSRVQITYQPQANSLVDGPPLQLAGCPCHLFLTVRSTAPGGASWQLEDNARIASHINPPNPPDRGLGFVASVTLLLLVGIPYVIFTPFSWLAIYYLNRRQQQQQPLAA